jgi:predicted RNA-binding Zn ribbon-like protein
MTLSSPSVGSQVYIDHDAMAGIREVVDLVNSDDRRANTDLLTTADELDAYVARHGVTGSRTQDRAELVAMRELRSAFREVFERAHADDTTSVVDALNGLLARSDASPRLVQHDDQPLHLHFTPAEASLERRLGAELAASLAIVVRDGGVSRLRICDAPNCARVLIDVSKNRSRRYCDTQCGNRENVAAYRQRISKNQGRRA